jgi:hypothetical protein
MKLKDDSTEEAHEMSLAAAILVPIILSSPLPGRIVEAPPYVPYLAIQPE